MKNFRCPACGGDGFETCHNPDHGFISAIGRETSRIGCPCCGHDEDHKIKKWVDGKYHYKKCYECDGAGIVSEANCNRILDDYYIDEPIEEFEL